MKTTLHFSFDNPRDLTASLAGHEIKSAEPDREEAIEMTTTRRRNPKNDRRYIGNMMLTPLRLEAEKARMMSGVNYVEDNIFDIVDDGKAPILRSRPHPVSLLLLAFDLSAL